MGKAVAEEEGGFRFKFLHQIGSSAFAWPKRPDEDTVSRDRIFDGPVQLLGHDPFSVDQDVLALIRSKYINLKKNLH